MSEDIGEGGYGSPEPSDEIPTPRGGEGDTDALPPATGDDGRPEGANDGPRAPERERPEDDYR